MKSYNISRIMHMLDSYPTIFGLTLLLLLTYAIPPDVCAAEVTHGSIAGRVLDASGNAVAAARVTAYVGREFKKTVKSATDGSYLFKRLPLGKYHLKAKSKRCYTLRLPKYDVEITDAKRTTLDLTLAHGGTFNLAVVDKKTGKPIADAEVVFSEPRKVRRTSNEDGKTSISGLDYLDLSFKIIADGYALQMDMDSFHAKSEPEKTIRETVELHPEVVITGNVLDENNKSMPDAVVTIDMRWQDRWGSQGKWEPAISDEKGAFRLGGLLDGEYTYSLTATKEGYAPGRARVQSNNMKGIRIVMRPGATIEGVVKNSKGAVVEGALVSLIQDASVFSEKERSTKTDANGHFKFDRVEAANYKIFAEKGKARSQEKRETIGWKDNLKGIKLRLLEEKEWTYSISGKVVDDIDGKPIAKQTVKFWSHSKFKTQTDASGEFTLTSIPPGKYKFYLPKVARPHIKLMGDKEVIVEDHDIKDYVIRLKRGCTIRGRVLLPSGKPAWEAKLSIIHPEYLLINFFRKVRTNAKGNFRARGMHPALDCRIRAELKGYAPSISESFNLRQGDSIKDVVIKLQTSGSLSGTVRDGEGRPLPEKMWVSAELEGKSRSTEPDKKGVFQLVDLPPGLVRIKLSTNSPRGWRMDLGKQKVMIVAGTETTNVDFLIKRDESEKPENLKGYIAGRVVGLDSDEGIEGITIYARRKRVFNPKKGDTGTTKTGVDGDFRIDGLGEHAFELFANNGMEKGYDSQELKGVASTEEDIPIVLRRLCGVEGRVVEKSTGKPVTKFTISEVGGREQKIKHAEGKFKLPKLRRGEMQLRVSAQGLGAAQMSIELEQGETRKDIVLELHEPWQVCGQVLRKKDNTPVAGAWVTAFSLKREPKKHSQTDANGFFAISGVYPGNETLLVEHPDFGQPWFPDIEIPEDTLRHEVKLELEEPARVKGRIFYHNKLPYEGVELNLGPGEYGYSQFFSAKTVSNYDGSYEFFPVPPGEHKLSWHMDKPTRGTGGYWTVSVDSGPGETAEFNFGRSLAVISGNVTLNDKPKGYVVLTFTKDNVKRMVQTDDDGNYLIYGLKAGRWHLEVTLPGQKEKILEARDIDIPEKGKLQLDFKLSTEE
jgi:Carboxypeptidase regulatory-like domain